MTKDIQKEFLSTITHEIRTPLTSIRGFSQTMLDNWDKLTDDKKQQFIQIISEQSERLMKLLENVLNVAKINSNENSTVLKEINLKSIIKKVLEMILVNNKNHEFILENLKENLSVLGDVDSLQQILINILENATKYSEAGSKIEISTGSFKNYNFIKIQDEGIGISELDQEKIFEKFYRSESYISSKTQGSGLGLYIAQNLAKKMDGYIEIKSPYKKDGKEFKGSEFTVFLPMFEIEKITQKVGENV